MAAIPQSGKPTNQLVLNYRYKDTMPPNRDYSDQLVANDMQLSITWGGLGVLLLIFLLIVLYRRSKERLRKPPSKEQPDDSVVNMS